MAMEDRAPGGRSLAKDLARLMRNIDGMSGGQARLVGWDEADLKDGITVSVVPDDGLYKDGEFMFEILCNRNYPEKSPNVYCETMVYHPNINTIIGDGGICLNLLDDENWSSSMTLEDVVQGILFLMHNPNLDDPLCVLFSPGMDDDEFADNVRQSLDGGLVEGCEFERNRVVRTADVGRATTDVGEFMTEDVGEFMTEDVSGTTTEDVSGTTTEDVSGTTTEDVSGTTTEDASGTTTDDASGAIIKIGVGAIANVGGATTENVGGATTENVGEAATENVGGAATENVGGAAIEIVGRATTEIVGGATVQDVGGAMEDKKEAVNYGHQFTKEPEDISRPANHAAENKRGTHELGKMGTSHKNVTGEGKGFHWGDLRRKIMQDILYLKETWWFSW